MLFLNTEKLKIEKSYNFQTRAFEVNDLDFQSDIRQISNAIHNVVDKNVNGYIPSIECCYELHIESHGQDAGEIASSEEIDAFETIVNIAVSEFFKALTMDKRRKREYRLGIPAAFSPVKCSISVLKKAVNNFTFCDKFNFKIFYKDLTYILVDEKEIKDNE